MNLLPERKIVMRLLRTASAGQPVPVEGHVVDDEELMACWESGLLVPRQHEEILDHLAACPQCRRKLAEMIRRGNLQIAEPEPVAVPLSVSAPTARSGTRWLRHALAACLLVAVGIVGWTLWLTGTSLGIPSHSALAIRGKVTDYGYLLDGQSVATKGPMFDTSLDRRQRELEQALKAKPDDRINRLDYGEVLLQQQQPAEATEVFQRILDATPYDPAAQVGLGLARFQQKRFDDALEQFEAVLQAMPDNLGAKLNAAACLARLGRTAEAIRYWREAIAETQDVVLRAHIEQAIRNGSVRP